MGCFLVLILYTFLPDLKQRFSVLDPQPIDPPHGPRKKNRTSRSLNRISGTSHQEMSHGRKIDANWLAKTTLNIISQTPPVWHIYLHWGGFGGECMQICHAWSVRVLVCFRYPFDSMMRYGDDFPTAKRPCSIFASESVGRSSI